MCWKRAVATVRNVRHPRNQKEGTESGSEDGDASVGAKEINRRVHLPPSVLGSPRGRGEVRPDCGDRLVQTVRVRSDHEENGLNGLECNAQDYVT
jgi:hypothetical protein